MAQVSMLPRVSTYLASLPNGLDSYPQCQSKAEVGLVLRDRLMAAAGPAFEAMVSKQVLASMDSSSWIPTTLVTAIHLAARDAVFPSDDALLTWAYEDAVATYRRPAFRALMLLMSPTLLVMGVAKRWSSFSRGTELRSTSSTQEGNTRLIHLELTYPAHLFSNLELQIIGCGFRAALAAASAKEPTVSALESGNTSTVFTARWTAA